LRKNTTKPGKSFLQGLKPVESKHFTSELKLRPPKEKGFFLQPVKPCSPDVAQTPRPVPPSVRLALFALRFYKAYLSMLFAGNCRFQPTCSQYSSEAIERFGLARGAWLTLKRLSRCQPLSRRFGYDPVPENWPGPGDREEVSSEALARDVCHSAAASREVPT
jgi:putative membrane protein insertion efficiency factor